MEIPPGMQLPIQRRDARPALGTVPHTGNQLAKSPADRGPLTAGQDVYARGGRESQKHDEVEVRCWLASAQAVRTMWVPHISATE